MSEAVERFRTLLRIPTVSYVDDARIDQDAFLRLHDEIERLYPRLHDVLEREIVDGYSLLYRWRGVSSEEPLVLMAHQDVVPVVPAEWKHAPFDAEIVSTSEGDEIHARGAIDDKGALVAILEAVESLAEDGFVPAHDVYLALGHNEEVAGSGAIAIAELLRERGIQPWLVLDEGGAVVDDALPGVEVQTAMVGVAERGIMSVRITATDGGGHASTPPPLPATARLARAITRVNDHPAPAHLVAPVRAMFATIAPYVTGPLAPFARAIGRLGPVLAPVLGKLSPETNAMVRTTAVATELTGSDGENVLATTASAILNVRLITGDSVAGAAARITRAIADPKVSVEVLHGSEPSPVSPWRGTQWRTLAGAVQDALGDEVVPTPYLQLGASDSRRFTGISAHVYRFAPFHLTRSERDALHSHNERIRVKVWLRGIEFYRALVRAR